MRSFSKYKYTIDLRKSSVNDTGNVKFLFDELSIPRPSVKYTFMRCS